MNSKAVGCTRMTGSKTLGELRKIHQMVRRFPVWPFDARSLGQFLVRITGPLVPALVTLGQDIARRWLLP